MPLPRLDQGAFSDILTPASTDRTQYAPPSIPSDQAAYLSNLLGYDANAAYQSYASSYAAARAAAAGQYPLSEHAGAMANPAEWAQSQVSSIEGTANAILTQYAAAYEFANNTPLPAELRQQLLQAIMAAPPSVRQDMLFQASQAVSDPAAEARIAEYQAKIDALGSDAATSTDTTVVAQYNALQAQLQSALAKRQADQQKALQTLNSYPYLNTVSQNYQTMHPSAADQQKQAALDYQSSVTGLKGTFAAKLGRQPTTAELKQLVNASDQERTQYIDQQTYHGMPYGQYISANQALVSAGWQQYFGQDPTDKHIKWAASKTPAEIKDFIDGSQSRIPGMNIGTLAGYEQYGNTLSQELFNRPLDDHLIGLLHSSMQAKP